MPSTPHAISMYLSRRDRTTLVLRCTIGARRARDARAFIATGSLFFVFLRWISCSMPAGGGISQRDFSAPPTPALRVSPSTACSSKHFHLFRRAPGDLEKTQELASNTAINHRE